MKTAKKITKVLFVEEQEHPFPVLAIFPEITKGRNKVECYSHIGQHSAADIQYYKQLPEASSHDYRPLYRELIGLGYNLQVLNKDQIEPIKTAITSEYAGDFRTIIVFKDGGIKIIDQDGSDRRAAITCISNEEMQSIIKAIQAP